jgi:hypothetical protein
VTCNVTVQHSQISKEIFIKFLGLCHIVLHNADMGTESPSVPVTIQLQGLLKVKPSKSKWSRVMKKYYYVEDLLGQKG